MENLKGLILSGGTGTRLRPITYTSAKQLVPVANKPVLFYGIEAMAAAGIRELGIIIAPETGEEIRGAAGDGSRFGVEITYIVQDAPLGLAHAVLTAEPFLGSDPFVMYLGDNLLQGGIADLVEAFRSNAPDALILLTPVPDPENYGVAELDESGNVKQLVEKPSEPATDLALVGVYMFTSPIHEAARAIEPSARGELEITDAIQWLVDDGRRVESHIVRGWWKDTGRLDDMLEANRLILETIVRRVEGELIDSQVDGRVVVEPGALLERATVRGPAIIGSGAVLRDAYVGPYTAVGAGCVIEGAEVEHSILLEASSVRGLEGRMESSLLGKNVAISRDDRQPRAYRFMVGDNSEIGILYGLGGGRHARRERDDDEAGRGEQAQRQRQRGQLGEAADRRRPDQEAGVAHGRDGGDADARGHPRQLCRSAEDDGDHHGQARAEAGEADQRGGRVADRKGAADAERGQQAAAADQRHRAPRARQAVADQAAQGHRHRERHEGQRGDARLRGQRLLHVDGAPVRGGALGEQRAEGDGADRPQRTRRPREQRPRLLAGMVGVGRQQPPALPEADGER